MSPNVEVSSTQLVPFFVLHSVDQNGVSQYLAHTNLFEVISQNPPNGFLVSSPADANGDVTFTFRHTNMNFGDDVRLSIIAVVEPVVAPQFPFTCELLSIFNWDLPRTQGGATPTVPSAKDNRGITVTF
jgi:hypothetical protein